MTEHDKDPLERSDEAIAEAKEAAGRVDLPGEDALIDDDAPVADDSEPADGPAPAP